MPVALAPGMGLNAYFSAVVGYRGSGTVRHCIHPLSMLLTNSYGSMHTLVFPSPLCWGSGGLEEASLPSGTAPIDKTKVLQKVY